MHSLTLPSKRSTLEGLSCISQENFQFTAENHVINAAPSNLIYNDSTNFHISWTIGFRNLSDCWVFSWKKPPKVQKSLKLEQPSRRSKDRNPVFNEYGANVCGTSSAEKKCIEQVARFMTISKRTLCPIHGLVNLLLNNI